MFGLEDELQKEIENLKRENESLKEYSIWLSDLVCKYHSLRNRVFSKEYHGNYEKVRKEVLIKFPIVQGFQNKLDIKNIGSLRKELNQEKLRNAVNVLLER